MKRALAFLCSALIVFFTAFCVDAQSLEKTQISVSAQAYVLYCPDNNQVVLSKNLDSSMGMASTTKIMTSLLALEYAQKNDKIVEFTSDMTAEGSSMYLKAGDKLRLSQLVAGMMTVSGNDAANAAAMAVSGDKGKFVRLMNARAKEMGMTNTSFANPSGLTEEGHYSTVYDMARLMSEAMNNKAFSEITKQKSITVDFISPEHQSVTYNNHNRLLQRYDYCIGGKTGYTKASGRCLVTCSEKDNLRLVAVTFNAPDDWQDHINLYEYGFDNLKAVVTGNPDDVYKIDVAGSCSQTAVAKVKEVKKFVADSDTISRVKIRVYVAPLLFAPVRKGDVVGRVLCVADGKTVLQSDIIVTEDSDYVKASFLVRFFRSLFR